MSAARTAILLLRVEKGVSAIGDLSAKRADALTPVETETITRRVEQHRESGLAVPRDRVEPARRFIERGAEMPKPDIVLQPFPQGLTRI